MTYVTRAPLACLTIWWFRCLAKGAETRGQSLLQKSARLHSPLETAGAAGRLDELEEELSLLTEDAAKSNEASSQDSRGASFRSFCADGDGFATEWSDEFDGEKLDTNVWQSIDSQGRPEGPQTLAVAGLETTACRTAHCKPGNVRVENGKLHLLSERSSNDSSKFFTGAVTTKGQKTWSDGPAYRMCISAKLPGSPGPSGKGVWPAHWMLPDNGVSESCLDEGEMDIMEMVNSDGGSYSTFHWMSSWPARKCADFDTFHKSAHSLTRLPQDWNRGFHEYALERSPHHLAFAVDGKVVLNVSAAETGTELSHTPFFLILNTAIGGGWPGEPTELTQLPVEHVIDYVRVARRKDAPASRPERKLRGPVLLEVAQRVEASKAKEPARSWTSENAPPPISMASLAHGQSGSKNYS